MASTDRNSLNPDNSLSIRPATLQDAELLLQWRNDPVTRQASHQTAEIAWSEHLDWLTRSLANPSRRIFIVEENKVPVGTVRVDESEGVSELSWTVAAVGRGRGIGKRMVALVAHRLKGPIRAEVKVGNEASRRIAESAGMHFDHERDGVWHFFRGPINHNS